MQLQQVDKVASISPEDFRDGYYAPMKPLVISGLSKEWPAYEKWNWDYFKQLVGDKKVPLYNNNEMNCKMQFYYKYFIIIIIT